MGQLLTCGKIHIPHGFRQADTSADSGLIVSIGVGVPFSTFSVVVFGNENNCFGLYGYLSA